MKKLQNQLRTLVCLCLVFVVTHGGVYAQNTGDDSESVAQIGSNFGELIQGGVAVWLFEGIADDVIRLTVLAQWDTTLTLNLDDEFIAFNDDDDELTNFNSRLIITLPQDGLYEIVVASYNNQFGGTYELIIESLTGEPGETIDDGGQTVEQTSIPNQPVMADMIPYQLESVDVMLQIPSDWVVTELTQYQVKFNSPNLDIDIEVARGISGNYNRSLKENCDGRNNNNVDVLTEFVTSNGYEGFTCYRLFGDSDNGFLSTTIWLDFARYVSLQVFSDRNTLENVASLLYAVVDGATSTMQVLAPLTDLTYTLVTNEDGAWAVYAPAIWYVESTHGVIDLTSIENYDPFNPPSQFGRIHILRSSIAPEEFVAQFTQFTSGSAISEPIEFLTEEGLQAIEVKTRRPSGSADELMRWVLLDEANGRYVQISTSTSLGLLDVYLPVVDQITNTLQQASVSNPGAVFATSEIDTEISDQLDRMMNIPGTKVSLNIPQDWAIDYFVSGSLVESPVLVLASDSMLLANGLANSAILDAINEMPEDVAFYARMRYDDTGNFGERRGDERLTIGDRRATITNGGSRHWLAVELQNNVFFILELLTTPERYDEYRLLLLALGESLMIGSDSIMPITPQTVGNLERLTTFRSADWALFNHNMNTYIQASHSGGTLRIYDLDLNMLAGEIRYTYRNNTRPFTGASIAADGRFIANDGEGVKLFSNTGEIIYSIPLLSPVAMAVISPNGQLIATNEANTVRVIYPETGDLYALFETDAINSLRFSPDSRYLAAMRTFGIATEVTMYDLIGKVEVARLNFQRSLRDWRFSASGRYFAVSDGRTLQVVDLNTNNTLQFSHGGTQQIAYSEPMPIAFSRDESLLVYADALSNVHAYSLATNELLYTIDDAHDNAIGGIAVNNAGTIMATAKVNANIPGRTRTSELDVEIKFWDLSSGRWLDRVIVPFGQGYDPYYLVFSEDDTSLFMMSSRSSNHLVTHLVVKPGIVIEDLIRDEIMPVNLVAVDFMDADGQASGQTGDDAEAVQGEMAWWDGYAPIDINNLALLSPINRVANAISADFSSGQLMVSENQFIARSSNGLALYPLTNFDVIQDVRRVSSVNATENRRHVLSPGNDILAVAGNAWVASLYNTDGRKTGEVNTGYRSPSQIIGMDFNSDGTQLLTIGNTGRDNGELAFWVIESEQKIRSIAFPVTVERLGLSPDRSLASVVLSNGELIIFDVERREEIQRFSHFGSDDIDQGSDLNMAFIVAGQFTVYDVTFTPDNRYAIFTASGATRDAQGNRNSFTNDIFVYDRIAEEAVDLPVRTATDIVVHPTESIIALPYLYELTVVNISTQERLFEYRYNVGTGISSTAFSPDGQAILFSNNHQQQDQFRAFDIRSGQLLATFTSPGDGRKPTEIAFHPSGRVLFFQTDSEIYLYTVPQGESTAQQGVTQTDMASSSITCNITTLRNVNLRTSASTSSNIGDTRSASTTLVADGQKRGGDGFTWWRVVGQGAEGGLWVRGDLVREEPSCADLPIIP